MYGTHRQPRSKTWAHEVDHITMKRIICIGNCYTPDDAAGPKVYDRLLQCALPNDIEVIDGGLAGLNLLRFIDNAERVVFVDNVSGFGQPNEIVVL